MLCRLVLLFLLTAAPVFAADPLRLDVPSLDGGSVSKKKASSLEVVITNEHSQDPVAFLWISVEKKGDDGRFRYWLQDITLQKSIIRGRHLKYKRGPFILKKGESMRESWNFLGASLGVYRFAVSERYSEALSGYVYHGVSKEFEITE